MKLSPDARLVLLFALLVSAAACGEVRQEADDAGTLTPAITEPTSGNVDGISDDEMKIVGTVSVNARASEATVRAYVGDTQCAETSSYFPADSYEAQFSVIVASSVVIPNCAQQGSEVRFTVDDELTDAKVAWQPGTARSDVVLVVGPAFARYTGSFQLDQRPEGSYPVIEAVVSGKVCGRQLNPPFATGDSYAYDVIVDPSAVTSGCGSDGATVDFQLVLIDSADGETRLQTLHSPETAVWTPGTFDSSAPTVFVPQ
jgi:hypothetical protein